MMVAGLVFRTPAKVGERPCGAATFKVLGCLKRVVAATTDAEKLQNLPDVSGFEFSKGVSAEDHRVCDRAESRKIVSSSLTDCT